VRTGTRVPVEYDPILSKLVVHAETREAAIARMLKALSEYVVLGIKTPIAFLKEVLASEPFARGATYTDFIPVHFADWRDQGPDRELAAIAFVAGEMTPAAATGSGTETSSGAPSLPTPWQTLGNWRM
jgi:acetyl/propionyl-CoA carboxylase alpha subunit